jgi:hypothetical protein
MAQVVEYLPSKCETLSSSHNKKVKINEGQEGKTGPVWGGYHCEGERG